MTRPSEFDARQQQLDRTARCAREAGFHPILDSEDLAPARGIVWGVLGGLCIIVALAMLLIPSCAGATSLPKRTVPGTDTPPATIVNTTAQGGAGGSATAVTSTTNTVTASPVSNSGAQAGAATGPVTAGNNLTLDGRTAIAPDVISYPTAPCRVAFGASGGGLSAVFGFSASAEDENCTLRETSRQLWNVGQRDAAVQVLCLNDDARLALEASGVACKVKRAAAPEAVKP